MTPTTTTTADPSAPTTDEPTEPADAPAAEPSPLPPAEPTEPADAPVAPDAPAPSEPPAPAATPAARAEVADSTALDAPATPDPQEATGDGSEPAAASVLAAAVSEPSPLAQTEMSDETTARSAERDAPAEAPGPAATAAAEPSRLAPTDELTAGPVDDIATATERDAPAEAPGPAATAAAEPSSPAPTEGSDETSVRSAERDSPAEAPRPAATDVAAASRLAPADGVTAGPVGGVATVAGREAPAELPGAVATDVVEPPASASVESDAPMEVPGAVATDLAEPSRLAQTEMSDGVTAGSVGDAADSDAPAEAPRPDATADVAEPSRLAPADGLTAGPAAGVVTVAESDAPAEAPGAVEADVVEASASALAEPAALDPNRQAAGADPGAAAVANVDLEERAGVALEEELGRQLGLVEAALVSSVVEGDAGLAEAFERALTRDRWRLRARLTLLGAAAVSAGPPPPSVFAGAAAVELLHLAQVHHDREAALVGDHLLARSAQLGMAADAETGEAVARCAVDHVRGQLLDLRDRYDTGRTLTAYTEAAHARIATLTGTATALGGRLAGGTEPQVAALRAYGEALGLALQLADDLHEVVADTTIDGQPTGEHLRTGVYTLPTLVAIHEAGELLAVLGRPLDRPALAHATQVVRRSEGIGVALTRIHAHVTEATAALAALDPGPATAGLTELVHAIGKQAWSSVEAQPLVDLPR